MFSAASSRPIEFPAIAQRRAFSLQIMRAIFVYLSVAVAACTALNLGHIENFTQTGNSKDSITIEWDFVEGDTSYSLHKYILVINNDFSNDIRCPVPHCTHTFDYLDACTEFDFKLTPHFDDPATGGDIPGSTVSLVAHTADETPGPPSSLVVAEDNDVRTTVQWQAPSLYPMCVDHYEVCFRMDNEDLSVCDTTTDLTFSTADSLEACGVYYVTVTPVTPSGITGSPLEEVINTRDGVPGPPKDVVVGLITPETVQLMWNNPDSNPLCVFRYAITYGKTHTSVAVSTQPGVREYDHHATLSPLDPCSNYTIDIVAVNKAELSSSPVTRFATTEETEPVGLPVISLDPSGTDSIDVSWGVNEEDTCAGHFQICWMDYQHPIEICENITVGGDNNFTITDLLPCSHYDIVITVVSPGGMTSNPTVNSTSTDDVVPSPVVDLQMASISANEVTITFGLPEENAQCISEYVVDVIDMDQGTALAGRQRVTSDMSHTINNFKACTNYKISVCTKSPNGLTSPWRSVQDRTLDATPSEPQVFGMNAFDETSVSLQWFQPATNPRCVSQYELEWEGDGASHSVTIPGGSNFKIMHTVTGLTPCVEYSFTLTAVSSVGESGPSLLTQTTKCR